MTHEIRNRSIIWTHSSGFDNLDHEKTFRIVVLSLFSYSNAYANVSMIGSDDFGSDLLFVYLFLYLWLPISQRNKGWEIT